MTEQDFRILLVICYKALETEQQKSNFKDYLNTHHEALIKLDINSRILMVLHYIIGMLSIKV